MGIYGEQHGWIGPGEQVSGLEDEYLAAQDKPVVARCAPVGERWGGDYPWELICRTFPSACSCRT